jgi:hypothetical protein
VKRIGGRCAVVAQSDVHFGMSRMGTAYSENVGVVARVFREPEAALAWLGVEPSLGRARDADGNGRSG